MRNIRAGPVLLGLLIAVAVVQIGVSERRARDQSARVAATLDDIVATNAELREAVPMLKHDVTPAEIPDAKEMQIVQIRVSATELLACGVLDLDDGRVGVMEPALRFVRQGDSTFAKEVPKALEHCTQPLLDRGIVVTSHARHPGKWSVTEKSKRARDTKT